MSASKETTQDNPIQIIPYDPLWQNIYQAEKQRILVAVKKAGILNRIQGVEHIGSTAVPNMAGKPVLDMMIGLRRPADLTEFPTVVLSALGYVPRVFSAASGGRNAMPPDRLMFSKYAPPGVNLHLFVFGDALWRRCTNIRDNLRAQPDVAAFYQKIKQGLARKYQTDLPGLYDGKDAVLGRGSEYER